MTTDHVLAEGKWKFDAQVTDAFDDMLARSIPAYNIMRELTTKLALAYIKPGTDVLDLGCSRGAALAPLVEHTPKLPINRFVGVDVSEPMLSASRSRFADEIRMGKVVIEDFDLRHGYPSVAASVTLAVLTVQFTPIEYRQRIIEDMYHHTVQGGAVLFVEKVLGDGPQLHDVMDAEYLNFKSKSGYSEEEILRKKASLEGVLVSLTAHHNEELLRRAGFRYVDCYYRWLNFAGWIAVR